MIQIPTILDYRPGLVHPIRGSEPSGKPISRRLSGGWALLLFLSTSCDGCHELWELVAHGERAPMPPDLEVLGITRAPPREVPGDVARRCGEGAVVMSDDAWTDYGVHSAPFFVLVDGERSRVASEGVAWAVDQIASAIFAVRDR